MSAPEVGRRIAWHEVPDRALVAVETPDGRLYALRSGSRGRYVGGPASWVGEDEEPSWSWFHGSTDGEPLVVALSVPAQASADHLRGLAEVFEVREELRVCPGLPGFTRVYLGGYLIGGFSCGDGLTFWAERIHAVGWRPGMPAEDAARLLSERA